MQPVKLLHKTFKKELPFIYKTRLNSLIDATTALLKGSKLSLTLLGRNISNKATTRSNIKKMDRLLANEHLHKEVKNTYTRVH